MTFHRITATGHPLYPYGAELYQISFPAHEQREARSQETILNENEYHYDAVCDGDSFVGLALYWETERYIYVEHLCVSMEMRNKQYGKRILDALKEKGKILILEIDPPVDTISIRRKGFYERCGFVENPYNHVHPPYHKGNSGHSLKIMTYPREITEEEYRNFNSHLQKTVMAEVF